MYFQHFKKFIQWYSFIFIEALMYFYHKDNQGNKDNEQTNNKKKTYEFEYGLLKRYYILFGHIFL